MALTEKVFGNVLVDWKAVRYVEDGKTPFKVMATLVFTSREEHEAVMASKIGATLLDDIKNYSNMAPVMMQQTDSACKKEMYSPPPE